MLSLFGLLLESLDWAAGTFVVWMVVLAFFIMSTIITMRTFMRTPENITFTYVLVLATAGAWVFYAYTTLGPSKSTIAYVNTEAILVTIAQSIFGCLVTIYVFSRGMQNDSFTGITNWLTDLMNRVNALPLSMIITCLVIHLALVTYSFSLGIVMSGTGGIMGEASILQSIILQISGFVSGIITLMGFLLLFNEEKRIRLFGFSIVLFQLILVFLGGRRGLLGIVMLYGIIWVIIKGLTFKRITIVTVSIILVTTIAWPTFLELRNIAQKEGIIQATPNERTSILMQSGNSLYKGKGFSINRVYTSQYKDNLQNRFSFLQWTVSIQEALMSGHELRYGDIAITSFLEVVPRFLWPGKLEYLGFTQIESKIQQWFGLPDVDGASTFLGAAIADGGWIGVFIYFVFFGVVLKLIMHYIIIGHFTLLKLWCVWAMFSLCFNVEAAVTSILDVLRLLIVILLFDKLLYRQNEIN
jgi:multisubunit Na+/H+ antiporter MnhC subunit